MTSQDHDTDPSTPGAKRFSDPRIPAGAPVELADDGPPPSGPRAARLNTDPGVAPPPDLLPVPQRPMGIVVPAVVSKEPPASDPIDLLLEGMSGDQPDRPRTTPQTDGQAAATYHAEHAVRAARTSPDAEPKVVIDRPPLHETLRIARSSLPSGEPTTWTETTAVSSQSGIGRVVVAVVAGLAVVAVIFLALQRTGQRATVSASASSSAPSNPPSTGTVPTVVALKPPSPQFPPPVTAAPAVTLEPIAPMRPAAEADTAGAAGVSAAPGGIQRSASPPSPAKANRPRPRPAVSPAKARAPDLGEFKAAF